MLVESVETIEDEGAEEVAAATETEALEEEGERVVDRGRVVAVALRSGVGVESLWSLSFSCWP